MENILNWTFPITFYLLNRMGSESFCCKLLLVAGAVVDVVLLPPPVDGLSHYNAVQHIQLDNPAFKNSPAFYILPRTSAFRRGIQHLVDGALAQTAPLSPP